MASTHYVLVHGANHGAWCWYKVRTLLEEVGHMVTCLDLKSAGIDPTNPDTLFKFNDYNQSLLVFLSSVSDSQKVILVGHSLGGCNVTQALYKFPTKIQAVVYLAASMVKKISSSSSTPKSRHNVVSSDFSPDMFEWGYGLGPNGPPTSRILKKEYQRQFLYSMSPLEDSTLAEMLLKPYPLIAAADYKLPNVDDSEIEKVPRVYIKTLHDNLISQESQDSMIKDWPPSDVLTINSDHSAFFSNPIDLVNLLLKVASKNCKLVVYNALTVVRREPAFSSSSSISPDNLPHDSSPNLTPASLGFSDA